LFASGDGGSLDSALKKHLTLTDYGLTLFTPARRAKALLDRYDRNHDGVLEVREWARRVDGKQKPRLAEATLKGIKQANPDVTPLPEITDYFQREHPYLTLESKQLLLPPAMARLAAAVGRGTNLRPIPTLVYLCRMQVGSQRVAGVVA